MTGDGLGRKELVRRIEEGDQRIAQSGKVGLGQGIAGHGAFGGIAEVVVLIAAVVDAETRANDGLSIQHGRRPGQADARAEVFRIGAVVGRALGAEAAAARDVNDGGTIQNLVRHRIVLIAQPQVQCEIRGDLEFVLCVARGEGAPVADHALALQISGRRRGVVDEILGRVVAEGGCGQGVAGVVQADAPDVHAELEGMPAADHGEVIDVGEGGADLGIERGVAYAVEGAGAHGDRRSAIGPVVVVGAIQPKLDLVVSGGREDVLVFEDEVRTGRGE